MYSFCFITVKAAAKEYCHLAKCFVWQAMPFAQKACKAISLTGATEHLADYSTCLVWADHVKHSIAVDNSVFLKK